MRLGLRYVTGLRETAGRAIVTAREARPVASVADLVARTGVNAEEAQTLAAVGALAALGGTRRGDLWAAAVPSPGPLFATAVEGGGSPTPVGPLRDMNVSERLAADYAGTGVTLGPHPLALRRSALARAGVVRAADLGGRPDGATVRVAGSVIVRQRPGTAKGFVFLSLEDEIRHRQRHRHARSVREIRLVLVTSPILLVKGILQSQDSVLSVRAAMRSRFPSTATPYLHDFG